MKNLLTLLFAFLLYSSNAFAQETQTWIVSEPPRFELAQPISLSYNESAIPGARIYSIRQGQTAQVTGVLLNPEANAWIISQIEFLQRYWILEMNRRVELTTAWANAEMQGIRSEQQEEIDLYQIRIRELENQNQILVRTNENMIRENRRQNVLKRLSFSTITITSLVFVSSVLYMSISR